MGKAQWLAGKLCRGCSVPEKSNQTHKDSVPQEPSMFGKDEEEAEGEAKERKKDTRLSPTQNAFINKLMLIKQGLC